MTKRTRALALLAGAVLALNGLASPEPKRGFQDYQLEFGTTVDPVLQTKLEKLDADLRDEKGSKRGHPLA